MERGSSITQRAGRSAFWQVLDGGWRTIVRLGASIFLARALTPTEFGIYGMAIIAREFIFVLGSLGMGAGIIVKNEIDDTDLCTFFWSMAGTRILMFLVGFFGAPLVVYIFDDSRVVDVLRVISLSFLLSIMAVSAHVILSKELKYFQMNLISSFTTLLESILAVLLVLNTSLGYWGLVIAMMVQIVVNNFALLILSRWMPKFRFSKKSFIYLFRYGINGLGFSINNYLSQNIDYLLVGRILGAQALGLYEFAYRIPHLVQSRIAQPVGVVLFPALALVKNDNQRLIDGYVKVVKYICLISFPIVTGLAAVAEVAVPVLWGEQWSSSVIPLQILCLAAGLRCIVQPLGTIFVCKNRPDLPFKISMISLAWTVCTVSVLGNFYGVIGVSMGMVLSLVPSYIGLKLAFKMIGANIFTLWQALYSVVMSTILSGGAAYFTCQFLLKLGQKNGSVLALSIVTGVVVFVVSVFCFFPKLAMEILDVIESVIGRKLRSSDKAND